MINTQNTWDSIRIDDRVLIISTNPEFPGRLCEGSVLRISKSCVYVTWAHSEIEFAYFKGEIPKMIFYSNDEERLAAILKIS